MERYEQPIGEAGAENKNIVSERWRLPEGFSLEDGNAVMKGSSSENFVLKNREKKIGIVLQKPSPGWQTGIPVGLIQVQVGTDAL